MNDLINVTIIAPDGQVYSNDQIALAVIRTIEGDVGIMAKHVPTVAALDIGEMHVELANGDIEYFSIQGGYAEFSDNLLTVVANSAENNKDIDVNRAANAEDKAKKIISSTVDATERRRAEIALKSAINRIQVAKIK